MGKLGRVAIVANPVAQSGAAAAFAEKFAQMLRSRVGESGCDMFLTERPGHAVELAASLRGKCDTLVAIGGDGMVHESANGLMRIPSAERPNFAVVPVGSGNDYALTLGMPHDPAAALHQILECDVRKLDVGRVNGEFFVETVSFGLDAAIALDTVERRKKTGRHGTLLYMESGLDQIFNHRVPQAYEARLEGLSGAQGGPLRIEGSSYVFAVQIGKTYGGHFKVCPDASAEDGMFDICIAHAPFGAVKALGVFMLARLGLHARFKMFEFHRASSLVVDFDRPPAVQADGERLEGSHFEIDTLPRALGVIVGNFKG